MVEVYYVFIEANKYSCGAYYYSATINDLQQYILDLIVKHLYVKSISEDAVIYLWNPPWRRHVLRYCNWRNARWSSLLYLQKVSW